MEFFLIGIVLLVGYALIRARIRSSSAKTMGERRHAGKFVLEAVEKDEWRIPSWARHDPDSIKDLSLEIKDALASGGVSKEKAARMASDQYVISTALLFAAGYEDSGMGKLSQIAAAATDVQMKAKSFERHYDRSAWPK